MKKLLVAIAFLAVSQISVAQDAARADVKKLIEMTGANSQIDVAKKQILGMIPEAKQAEFLKEFDASLVGYYAKFEDFYVKEFTPAEVKEMIKFYETPVGKKIKAKAGVQAEVMMSAVQAWSTEIQGIMMKYIQQ